MRGSVLHVFCLQPGHARKGCLVMYMSCACHSCHVHAMTCLASSFGLPIEKSACCKVTACASQRMRYARGCSKQSHHAGPSLPRWPPSSSSVPGCSAPNPCVAGCPSAGAWADWPQRPSPAQVALCDCSHRDPAHNRTHHQHRIIDTAWTMPSSACDEAECPWTAPHALVGSYITALLQQVSSPC